MSFLEIFQPGLRHQREERDRRNTLAQPTDHGSGAPLGIDLDAGTATISVPKPASGIAAQSGPELDTSDGMSSAPEATTPTNTEPATTPQRT